MLQCSPPVVCMSLEQKEMNLEEWIINLEVDQEDKEIQDLQDFIFLSKII